MVGGCKKVGVASVRVGCMVRGSVGARCAVACETGV